MALTERLTAVADAIRRMSEKQDKLTLEQMPHEILQLQPLNFKVAGNPQPEAPAEDTIWVDTDAEITGWCFSATEPETPAEGMVWISTGVSSPAEFNALKKNSIVICPLSAKQHISGAWVERTAKSYQGGRWVDWGVMVFDRQSQDYGTISAGLQLVDDANSSKMEDSNPYVRMWSTSNNRAWQWTEEIDFSRYNTLEVTGYADSGKFGVANSLKKGWSNVKGVTETASMDFETSEAVHTLDISELSGSGYIGFYTSDSNKSVYVKRVRLI